MSESRETNRAFALPSSLAVNSFGSSIVCQLCNADVGFNDNAKFPAEFTEGKGIQQFEAEQGPSLCGSCRRKIEETIITKTLRCNLCGEHKEESEYSLARWLLWVGSDAEVKRVVPPGCKTCLSSDTEMLYRWETDLPHIRELHKNATATYDSSTVTQLVKRPAKLDDLVFGDMFQIVFLSASYHAHGYDDFYSTQCIQRPSSHYGCLEITEKEDGMKIALELNNELDGPYRLLNFLLFGFYEEYFVDGMYWKMQEEGRLESEQVPQRSVYIEDNIKVEVLEEPGSFPWIPNECEVATSEYSKFATRQMTRPAATWMSSKLPLQHDVVRKVRLYEPSRPSLVFPLQKSDVLFSFRVRQDSGDYCYASVMLVLRKVQK